MTKLYTQIAIDTIKELKHSIHVFNAATNFDKDTFQLISNNAYDSGDHSLLRAGYMKKAVCNVARTYMHEVIHEAIKLIKHDLKVIKGELE